jgi:hypothetical protein
MAMAGVLGFPVGLARLRSFWRVAYTEASKLPKAKCRQLRELIAKSSRIFVISRKSGRETMGKTFES